MEEDNPVRKLTFLKPEGSRKVGRPKLRWMDGIEEAWNQGMEKTDIGQELLEEGFGSGQGPNRAVGP
ncbi:hypothetical protein C0J52_21154 [Blattella germanica]|nr:hypothetical protein C0J52_21154 [Blattella germanica]